jgi:glycine C-acetyltransferase
MASVRFICGTAALHKELEKRLANFLQMEDVILFSSCFDANGGIFEPFFGAEDAIISDALNHASIIDGIRLCKAKRFRYENNNLEDLEAKLKEAEGSRFKIIVTDGVFSMDGIIANLKGIAALKKKYGALLMIDDSHAVGFMGEKGRGTHEHAGIMGEVDFITGTLGKALGGASGGYIAGKKEAIEWLRQKARPYLFSNTLAPMIAATSLTILDLLEKDPSIKNKLTENSRYFRNKMSALGFTLVPGEHPIIPVMLYDAKLAQTFAEEMLKEGVYVIGFFYPVVPMNKARIRTQISNVHSKEDLDRAINAFEKVGKKLGVIPA